MATGASARFLGAFISKNQMKCSHNKNKIGTQLPFPSAESSNKDEESTKYVGTLTNIKAHHSVSFRIYLKELFTQLIFSFDEFIIHYMI